MQVFRARLGKIGRRVPVGHFLGGSGERNGQTYGDACLGVGDRGSRGQRCTRLALHLVAKIDDAPGCHGELWWGRFCPRRSIPRRVASAFSCILRIMWLVWRWIRHAITPRLRASSTVRIAIPGIRVQSQGGRSSTDLGSCLPPLGGPGTVQRHRSSTCWVRSFKCPVPDLWGFAVIVVSHRRSVVSYGLTACVQSSRRVCRPIPRLRL
jgi:hypothetical protein